MNDLIVGACSTHPLPDIWFPEYENGRPKESTTKLLIESIAEAKGICGACPEKARCLEYGLEENNLPWGIFGGKLAGERLAMLGMTLENVPLHSDEGRAIVFFERIESRLKQ